MCSAHTFLRILTCLLCCAARATNMTATTQAHSHIANSTNAHKHNVQFGRLGYGWWASGPLGIRASDDIANVVVLYTARQRERERERERNDAMKMRLFVRTESHRNTVALIFKSVMKKTYVVRWELSTHPASSVFNVHVAESHSLQHENNSKHAQQQQQQQQQQRQSTRPPSHLASIALQHDTELQRTDTCHTRPNYLPFERISMNG